MKGAIAAVAVLCGLMGANALDFASGVTPVWGVTIAVVPALIIVAAVILSLEILELTLVSRPLSALTLIVLWGGLLTEELQISSVLAAIVYHCIQEVYIEWTLGFPSIHQEKKERKITLWALFWMRVFIWGSTMATAGIISKVQTAPTDPSSPALVYAVDIALTALLFTIMCEVTEVLVLLYFSDRSIQYQWRNRVLLWVLSFAVGAVVALDFMAVAVAWIQQRATSPIVVGSLVAVMVIALYGPWHRIWSKFFTAVTVTEEVTAKDGSKTMRRRTVLYRSQSTVEVATLTAPHYDLRDTTWEARSAILHSDDAPETKKEN